MIRSIIAIPRFPVRPAFYPYSDEFVAACSDRVTGVLGSVTENSNANETPNDFANLLSTNSGFTRTVPLHLF